MRKFRIDDNKPNALYQNPQATSDGNFAGVFRLYTQRVEQRAIVVPSPVTDKT